MSSTISRFIRSPFALFVTIGFLTSLVIFQILMDWIGFLAILYGKPDLGYHELPPFVHLFEWTLPWVVWLILAVMFLLDLRKRSFIRTRAYFTGIVLAAVVTFIKAFIQYMIVMSEF